LAATISADLARDKTRHGGTAGAGPRLRYANGGNVSNYRWLQEIEEEREREELTALKQVDAAGLHEVAVFLAGELGLTKAFQQEHDNA
jgi:hypothetical protein